jgi:sec-independent protein translocase protein TatC
VTGPMAEDKRKSDEDEDLAEGTLVSHLIELRQRLMRAFGAVMLIFVCLLPFQTKVFDIVSEPIKKTLPEGSHLIAIGTISPFFTPLKTTFYVALFAAMPVVLYQAWRFVAPGLYRQERRFAMPLIVSSIMLFYTGMAFAYFVVFKLVFGFIFTHVPTNVLPSPDINEYLSFVLRMVLAFGLAFEVPIATFILVWSRLVSLKTLSKQRPYVFLGTFVIGMFLTPPDMISQTLLAIPMYMLYESGLILSRILLRDRLAEERAAEEEAGSDANA